MDKSKQKSKKFRERRQTPRLKKEVTVQYRIKKAAPVKGMHVPFDSSADITRTKDLGEEGVLFTVSYAIPLQTILEIKLRLPKQTEHVELEGHVVSCTKIVKDLVYGIGVKFINLKDKQRKRLRDFVQLSLAG